MQHAYPLDDLLDGPPEPSPEEVHAQVEDWLERLRALYAEIEAWAGANGWQVVAAPATRLEHPRLETAGLGPIEQPALELHAPSGDKVSIKPKALWTAGANGRIDIFTPRRVYVLVDVAESLTPPRWLFHRLGRGPAVPFTADQLADTI